MNDLAASLLADHYCDNPSCARVIRQAVHILRSDAPHELTAKVDQMGDNGCASESAPTLPETTCDPSGYHRKDANVDSIAHPADRNAQQRLDRLAADLHHVRQLLADSIAQREHLVTSNIRLWRQARHWFVPGLDGYCAACSLPQENARHAPRGAAG